MGTNATPQTTPTTPGTPEQKVSAAGAPYVLSQLTPQQAQEIYHRLTPKYKQQADQLVNVILVYQEAVKVAREQGLNDPQQLLRGYLEYLGGPANQTINEGAQKAFDALGAAFTQAGITKDQVAAVVPGGQTLLLGGRVIGTGLEVADGALDGLWNGTGRTLNFITSLYKQYGPQIGGGQQISKEDAQVFARVIAGMRQDLVQQREGQPFVVWPWSSQQSQINISSALQYGYAGTQWTTEWLAQTMPGIAVYIIAAWQWITNWSEPKKSWDTLLSEAKESIAHMKPVDSARWRELVADAMYDTDGAEISHRLVTAGHVGNVPVTQNMADAVTTNRSTIQTRDGSEAQLNLANGQGVTVTTSPASFTEQAWDTLTAAGKPTHVRVATVATSGVAIAATGTGIYGFGEGFLRRFFGSRSGPVERLAKWQAELKTAQEALASARAAQAAAQEGTPAAARAAKEVRNAERAVSTAETLITHNAPAAAAHGASLPSAAVPVGEGFWSKVWNAPRNLGRKVGAAVGHVTERIIDGGSMIWKSTGAALLGAERLPLFWRGVGVAGKYVAVVPVIGIAGTAIVMSLVPPAKADVIDGEQISGPRQLKLDWANGIIKDPRKYNAIALLQTLYVGSGLAGGLGSVVGVEALQNALTLITPDDAQRYFPPALVEMISGKSAAQLLDELYKNQQAVPHPAAAPLPATTPTPTAPTPEQQHKVQAVNEIRARDVHAIQLATVGFVPKKTLKPMQFASVSSNTIGALQPNSGTTGIPQGQIPADVYSSSDIAIT